MKDKLLWSKTSSFGSCWLCPINSTGRVPALQAGGCRFKSCIGHFRDVAQSAERLIWDQEVAGSNPVIPILSSCSSVG